MVILFLYAADIWLLLRRLGGLGLVLLGFTDGSLIPLPGSMDALTIVLAARHHDLWFYYAVMATLGSTAGGTLTYRFALKRGKPTLTRRLGEERTQRLCRLFSRWGFWAVAVPAMLPPPFPIVPLKSSFMVTSIAGFFISVYFVMPLSKTWGFTFILFFVVMFLASVISMSYAPIFEKKK